MNENILTINVTNWITVTLIAVVGFMVLGFAQSYYAAKQAA